MTETEGLVLQGCGGEPQEWVDGINGLFIEEGILQNGDKFKEISVFEHDGLTNLVFHMEGVDLNIGRLAVWRLNTHGNFGGTWLSDYLLNKFGINTFENEPWENRYGMELGNGM